MGTYDRLIKLYKSSNSITPLEDFTTEILAGILELDVDFKNEFVSSILKIKETEIEIFTQKTYKTNDSSHVRIDLVLENKNVLCFIENKVESRESTNQLDKYSSVLDRYKAEKETYLFYCTKYYDPKEESRHNFNQFRWYEISKLIKSHLSSNQNSDFLNFLLLHNMANNAELTNKEIFFLQNLKPTLSFLDDSLELIKDEFVAKFGKLSKPDKFQDFRKFSRYIHLKNELIGDNYSEIAVGFYFEGDVSAEVWIYLDEKNSKLSEFKLAMDQNKHLFDYIDIEGNCCGMSKKLTSFLESEKPIEDLESWFILKLNNLSDFINITPKLEWKI